MREEMLILHAEQVRVAKEKAAKNTARDKEHQELLKKIAELEMKQAAADNHNKGLRHEVDGNWHSVRKIAVLLNIE